MVDGVVFFFNPDAVTRSHLKSAAGELAKSPFAIEDGAVVKVFVGDADEMPPRALIRPKSSGQT